MSASKYPLFDRTTLSLCPLAERRHDLDLTCLLPLEPQYHPFPELNEVGAALVAARDKRAANILVIGGHVIRSGVQRYIIDLMRRGILSCIAMNGACVIHDFEFALIGATTESVARYVENGQFGLWKETGIINDIINSTTGSGLGLGEAVGRYLHETPCPHRDISILAEAYRLGIPATVHVGIGYDIIHEHPNCNGAAIGAASYRDFLIFAAQVENLSGGMVMNFGTAVMGPEVFLKALAMVRNKLRSHGRQLTDFSTLVCDLKKLPATYRVEAARNDSLYYFRPWKTLLVRTTGTCGNSYYVRGDHRHTVPALWTAINDEEHRHEVGK